jgi:ribosomal protein S27AE
MTMLTSTLDRRSFLRGSALFAAAFGLGVVSAGAEQQEPPQQPQQPKEKDRDKDKEEPKKEPKDPFGDDEKGKTKKTIDKDGREYRICPQCGYNMYKEGRMWVCENCGYSYVE